jgi:hypothetical protein
MLHFIGHSTDVVMKSSGGSFEAKHIHYDGHKNVASGEELVF